MINEKANRLAYRATREYVNDNHPLLIPFFDEIWKLANSEKDQTKTGSVREEVSALGFVGDEVIVQIVQIVVPFLTGTFSAVVADVIWQKLKSKGKKADSQIITVTKDIRIQLDIKKDFSKRLLPYIFKEIENEIKSERKVQA